MHGMCCSFNQVSVSWATGDNAAKNGIDLRYFFNTTTVGLDKGNKLMAAVRFRIHTFTHLDEMWAKIVFMWGFLTRRVYVLLPTSSSLA